MKRFPCVTGSKYLWYFLICCLCLPAALTFAAPKDSSVLITMRLGESVSYVSFKLYGTYNPEIEEAIKQANPKLDNINDISAGQKLFFPSPASVKTKETAAPKPDTLRTSNAYITYLDGKARVQTGDNEWKEAKVNQELKEGNKIRTQDRSKAEIITEDGDVLRISENTEMEVNALKNNPQRDLKKSGFFLLLGKMWNKAKSMINPNSEYIVRTPTAISGVRGTQYTVAVGKEQDTTLRIYSGSVRVWNPDMAYEKPSGAYTPPERVPGPHRVTPEQWEEIVLREYQQLYITRTGIQSREEFDPDIDAREDPWIQWNMKRDKDLDQGIL